MALSPDQTARIAAAVNSRGVGKYTFLTAASTNADKKLAVVTVFTNNGELHSTVVGVGDNANWLSSEEQFELVLTKALNALARP